VSFIGSMVVAISFNLSVRAVVHGRTSLFEEMRLLCCSCNRGVFEFPSPCGTTPRELEGGGGGGRLGPEPQPTPPVPQGNGCEMELHPFPCRDVDDVSRGSIVKSSSGAAGRVSPTNQHLEKGALEPPHESLSSCDTNQVRDIDSWPLRK